MRRMSILTLFVVASIALMGCSSAPKKSNGTGASNAVMAEAEHEDFIEYMKQRANCGELFRNIMRSLEDTCEVFDDCLGGEEVYMTMSFSNLREQLSLVDVTGDGGGIDAY